MRAKTAVSALCAVLAIAATPIPSSASTAAGSWSATASLTTPRAHATATLLGNGRVLVVGGVDELSTELYDPPTGRWMPGGTLHETHWGTSRCASQTAACSLPAALGTAPTPSCTTQRQTLGR